MRAKFAAPLLTALCLLIGSASHGQGYSMQQAYSLFQRQDWNGLRRYAADWTKAQPNQGLAWYCVGEAAYHQHRYNDAAAGYQRATQLMPKHASYYNDLSASYFAAGNHLLASKAIRDGEAAAAANFSEKDWYVYGNAAAQLEEFDHAIKNYNNALEMNPKNGAVWTNLGYAYELKGDTQKAMPAYNKGGALGNPLGKINAQNLRARLTAAAHPVSHGSYAGGHGRYNNVVEMERSNWSQQHSNSDQRTNPFGGSQ